MSIRPIILNTDGSIDAVYDEKGHSGTIPASAIIWTASVDGTENHFFVVLPCPDGCGTASTYPVGGGAVPEIAQQIFVNKASLDGCACGEVVARDDSVPFAHMRMLCNRMDGPGRWKLDTPAMVAAQAAAPGTFQVVYRTSDRMIIGMYPDGSVASDHAVQDVPADQYDELMRFDPAYLSANGRKIVSSPAEVNEA